MSLPCDLCLGTVTHVVLITGLEAWPQHSTGIDRCAFDLQTSLLWRSRIEFIFGIVLGQEQALGIELLWVKPCLPPTTLPQQQGPWELAIGRGR